MTRSTAPIFGLLTLANRSRGMCAVGSACTTCSSLPTGLPLMSGAVSSGLWTGASIRTPGAVYDTTLGEWILPYEAVRGAKDPDGTLMDFLQSTYEAVAGLGQWDRTALERPL